MLSVTAGLRKLTIIPSENRRRQHRRVEQAYQITAALGVKCGEHGHPECEQKQQSKQDQYFFQSGSLLSDNLTFVYYNCIMIVLNVCLKGAILWLPIIFRPSPWTHCPTCARNWGRITISMPTILNAIRLKRGLRNSDGTGVMAGLTRICSVEGYYILDGERIPTGRQVVLPWL